MIKILAIDDIGDNLIILKAIIKDVFPESIVYSAQNGPKGIELAIAHDPDVILLDILMPEMDGFEVCHHLKLDERVRDIPVVFITAIKDDKSNRIKALEAGAEAFLSKPIDETELTAQIRAMVKIKQANTEKRDEKMRLTALILERTQQLEQELEERKKAEAALKKSEEQLRGIFDNLQDAYFQVNQDGKFTVVSPSAISMYGYKSKEEMIGLPAQLLYADPQERDLMLSELHKYGIIKDFVSQGRKRDGTTFWASMNIQLLYNNNGQVLGTEGVVRDINERKLAEKLLVESEERFKHIFESANVGKSITLFNGEINVNQAFCDLLGYTKEELTNKKWHEITHVEDIEFTQEIADSLIRGEKAEARFNKRYLHKNGEPVWTDVSVALLRDQQGKPKQFITTIIDITERKQAEELLRKSEEKHRALFEQASDGIFIADSQGNYLDVNSSGCAMLGYSHEEILKFNIRDIVTAENLSKNDIKFKELNTSRVILSERELKCKNGTVIPVEISGKMLPDGRLQGIVRDITERKGTEEKLRESEEKFRNLFENMNDAFALHKIIVDKNNKPIDYQFIDVNPVFCNRLGMKPKDIISHTALELFPKTEQSWIDVFGKVAITGEPIQFTNYSVELDRSYETRLYCPRPGYFAGLFSDVTEKIKVEEALRESEETTRTLLNGLPESNFLLDLQGNIIAANSTVAKRIGYPLEELKGHSIYEFVPPSIANRRKQAAEQVIQTGQPVYFQDEIHGHYIDNRIHPIFGQDGHVHRLAVIGLDITERIKAETALRESETQYRLLADHMTDTIWTMDMDLITNYISPSVEKLRGYTLEEIQQIPLENQLTPDTYLLAIEAFKEEMTKLVTDPAYYIKRSIELEFFRKDGTTYWSENTFSLIRDENGNPISILGEGRDITERKLAELALHEKNIQLIEAKEKAEESDRLKSTFLANMSHEIRTPLNSIIGFSDLMLDPFFGPGQHTEFAGIIKENGNNLLTIISDIMDLSKIEAGQVQVKNRLFFVNQLIADIQKENSFRAIEKGIELRLDSSNPKDEIFIKSDEHRLRQVLVNLVSNAIKFTDKGLIEIGVKETGSFIQFHVKDTGIGIPTIYHDQIFERFRQVESAFSRKYGGNGLGLPISKSLVELLGGKIWMESEEGKGSIFFFTIPNI